MPERGSQNAYFESEYGAGDQSLASAADYQSYGGQQHQINGPLAMWNNGLNASKGRGNYTYGESTYHAHMTSGKQSRSSGRTSISPGNENRRQPNSPRYFNGNGMMNVEMDQDYMGSQQSHGIADIERGLQRLQFSQAQPPPYFQTGGLFSGQLQGQYGAHAYDFPPAQYRPNAQQYGGYSMSAMPFSASSISAPRGPAGDGDIGRGVRSVLLEEFRSNAKSTRRYELKV